MNKFLLLGNSCKEENQYWMKTVEEFIIAHQATYKSMQVQRFSEMKTKDFCKSIPENTQCIIVLGGDGTLIRCAGAVLGMNIPLIGMNLGTVGYLCDIDEQNWKESLTQLIEDRYTVEDRMMLTGYSEKLSRPSICLNALNDIVIFRYGDLRVVDYKLYVNHELLNTYTADGLIVSTPTGSTGYSMSCGGPIVDPAASMIVITPISPHTWGTRSIVLNSEDEIMVEIGERHSGIDEMVKASYDGDYAEELYVGDRIIIRKSSEYTKLVKLKRMSFVDNIRKKMQEQK